MTRYYSFNLDSGEEVTMTIQEAIEKQESNPAIAARLKEIIANSKIRRRCRDGFVAGWQENINEYAGGRKEYDRILKEKGLVEIGYDYIPKESTRVTNPCANIEFALHAKEIGVDLSDREVEAISTGEYFKEGVADLG